MAKKINLNNATYDGRQIRLKKLTGSGLLLSIMFLLQVSGLAIIPMGVINVTLLQIPVVVGTIFYGLQSGLILGLFFGLISCYRAWTIPALLNIAFMNPVVSVLPRLLIPVTVHLLAYAIRFKSTQKNWFKSIIIGVIGSMSNTFFVFLSLSLFYKDVVMNVFNISTYAFMSGVLVVAASIGIPESIVCALITGMISRVLSRK